MQKTVYLRYTYETTQASVDHVVSACQGIPGIVSIVEGLSESHREIEEQAWADRDADYRANLAMILGRTHTDAHITELYAELGELVATARRAKARSEESSEAAAFGREMAEVFGNKDISIHEMSCVLNELTEDARTVAEMLLEVRPFIPAARRILRRLRGPRATGTLQEAEEELEYLRARREYVESLMRGDQTDAAKRFFELEKYRLGKAIKNTESRVEWLKE